MAPRGITRSELHLLQQTGFFLDLDSGANRTQYPTPKPRGPLPEGSMLPEAENSVPSNLMQAIGTGVDHCWSPGCPPEGTYLFHWLLCRQQLPAKPPERSHPSMPLPPSLMLVPRQDSGGVLSPPYMLPPWFHGGLLPSSLMSLPLLTK